MARTRIDRGSGRCLSVVVVAQAEIAELEWTDDVTATLEHPTSVGLLPWMRREVLAGVAQLFRFRDARDCLYVVTRIDHEPLEWTICYARGTGVGKFGPLLIALAKSRGWPLRVHVDAFLQYREPARVRMFKRLGFELAEYVLRCNHGQQWQGQQREPQRIEFEQHDHVQRRQQCSNE